MELTSSAIKALQADLAAGIAGTTNEAGTHFLSVLSIPGISPETFGRACRAARVAIDVVGYDGKTRTLWPKFGSVDGTQWKRIWESACVACGTTPEAERASSVRELRPYVERWRRDLEAHQVRKYGRPLVPEALEKQWTPA